MNRCVAAVVVVPWVVCAGIVGGSAFAQPSTVEKRGVKDSFISLESEQNGGESPVLRLGEGTRALVAFDLSDLSLSSLASARLILSLSEPASGLGPDGRPVSVYRLTAPWTEGGGSGDGPAEGTGVTWSCPTDQDLTNSQADCIASWAGGTFSRRNSTPVVHTNDQTGQVEWDVTEDVLRGASLGWIVALDLPLVEGGILKSGSDSDEPAVSYHSRESAEAQGDSALAPTLVLEFADVEPPEIIATGSADLLGSVFHVETGEPIEGAEITVVEYPGSDDSEVRGQALSAADGSFVVATGTFEGTGDFLVRIRKSGFAENLRRIEIMVGRCWALDDAFLNPVGERVMVEAEKGGMLTDDTGSVTLEIPPNALQKDSDIGVTILNSAEAVRDELPQLVAPAGTFIDIDGVFGDETTVPVKMRLPNIYNLPVGTKVPFGKIDHNTLEWQDLRVAFEKNGDPQDEVGLGEVVPDGNGGSVIEVEFSHFCTVCTGYCLPYPEPDPDPDDDDDDDDDDDPDNDCDNSVISRGEGYLWETVELPGFREYGARAGISFGYFSGAAQPSVTLSARVDYKSTRPVERTIYEFKIEGLTIEAVYGFSENDAKPYGTFFWDGLNGLGGQMPTGAYTFEVVATSLNADAPVALTDVFGGQATTVFNNLTYPGLTPLKSSVIEGRALLVNLTESPYGVGWSLINEERLYFDPDGCIVLVEGNAQSSLFTPSRETENLYDSPEDDFSSLSRNPADGTFLRVLPDGSEHYFTPFGRIERIVTRNGETTRFLYIGDALTSVVFPTGYFYDLEYDERGKLSQVTDSAGRTTLFEVDEAGDLVGVTDPLGSRRAFQYDSDHNLTGQSVPRGSRREYVYENGRVVAARAYDTDGGTLMRERRFFPADLNGEAGSALAEGRGTLLDPIPVAEKNRYYFEDGRGARTYLEADLDGNVVRVEDALGQVTQYSYNERGQLIARVDPNGSRLEYTYDDSGNLTQTREVANGNRTVVQTFGDYGLPTERRDQQGRVTKYAYDAAGNLSVVTDDLDRQTEFQYNDALHPAAPTRTVSASGQTFTWSYTLHGNVATQTDSLGRTLRFEYDAAGNVTRRTDPNGAVTRFQYDALNRLVEQTDPLGHGTVYSYVDAGCDCQGDKLGEVTLPSGSSLRFEYDGLGRLTREVDPYGNEATFAYDPEGSMLAYTNRDDQTITYGYDLIGRLIMKDVPGGGVTTYEYDPASNLIFAGDAICQLRFDYDGLNRMTVAETTFDLDLGEGGTFPFTHTLEYQYDAVGNVIRATDLTGQYQYEYDEHDRLIALTNPHSEQWNFEYNEVHRRSETIHPNGVVANYEYGDVLGLVEEIDHRAPDDTQLPSILYGRYDAVGNIALETLELAAETFEFEYLYDELSQIVEQRYSATAGETQDDVSAQYDEGDRLLAEGGHSYTYNNEGRLIRKEEQGTGLVSLFSYDAEGRLLEFQQVLEGAGPPQILLTTSYVYDPFGRRVQKNVNGVVTRFVYDREDILLELDGSNQIVRSYTHGQGTDEPLALTKTTTGETLYYHADKIGSIVMMTDADANVVQEYTYDAWGNVLVEADPSLRQPYSFTGREREPESGLLYYRARYYDPELGRFLSEDPLRLDSGSKNFFAYVRNNPVNRTDPFGLTDTPSPGPAPSCEPDCKDQAWQKLSDCALICAGGGSVICSVGCLAGCALSTVAYPACVAACCGWVGIGVAACTTGCLAAYAIDRLTCP